LVRLSAEPLGGTTRIEGSVNQKLEHFPIPTAFEPVFEQLVPHLEQIALNHAERRSSFEGVSGQLELPFNYLMWLSSCESLVTDLELVMGEMADLPSHPWSPKEATQRYFLLFRTFFHELFRAKEQLSMILARLRRLGAIDRTLADEIKQTYYEAFREALELRNRLVHSTVSPTELEEKLTVVSAAESFGFSVVPVGGGDRIKTSSVLREACETLLPFFRDETDRLVSLLNTISKLFAECIMEKPRAT
jgi:hypothetical protein